MRKKSIPTFIGLFVLIFGLAAGLVLLRGQQLFKLGAAGDFAPQDVRIANVSDNAFTVSWTTAKESFSFIKWGETSGSIDKKVDGATKVPSFVHSVSISGATPSTPYFFKINSGGVDYDNNKIPWQVKTGPTLALNETVSNVSGSVLTPTGTPGEGSLVYLTVGGGAPLSTTTSQKGSWIILISQARTQDLSSYVAIDESSTLLEITVNAGPDGLATAQIYPQSARPVPPIILGEINDFKNAPISKLSSVPDASINVPDETEPVSGFNVQGVPSAGTPETVTLESVDQGEIITSTSPEFFGEGPPGETITITVESEAQTAEVIVASTGEWKWSPPSDISEGTHKVKISWRDAGGILRTIERTFIVQAAEGPAFESTPSAGASPSTSPTASPKASPTASPSGIATASASPTLDPDVSDSGTITPTIALSIMGIGLLAFSLFIFKESSA